MEKIQRYPVLIFSAVWGVSAVLFLAILFLAVLGGPVSVREINPSKITAFESGALNPSAVSYRIPNMGIKSLIFGGLISPLQVSILENGQPLPVVLCGLEQFQFDNQNCYAVQSGRVYFSSSDGSSVLENGNLYQITWHWKPSIFLVFASLLFLIIASVMLGKKNLWVAQGLFKIREWIALQPMEIWVVAGFFISYVLFFFIPIFLNTLGTMQQNLVNVPVNPANFPETMLAGSDHQVVMDDMVRDFFFKEPQYNSDLLIWRNVTKEKIKENLEKMLEKINEIKEEDFTKENLEKAIMVLYQDDRGEFLWPLRACLTGKESSPGPFEIAEILGNEKTIKRINYAINLLEK